MIGATADITPRELELLRELATADSPKQIAARLFITKRTVDFHTGNLYRKLGVSSRMQALHEGRRRGLVEW